MTKINVAVIGTGYWGKNLVRNFFALGALHTICERDESTRQRFRQDYSDVAIEPDFDQVLANPDINAVVISTPAETHAMLVRQALNAGKDVYVEKPLCLSVQQGRALVDLARERNRILMVGHLLWYHPAIRKLKELIDNGELGRIQYIYSNRLNLGKIRREENILWSFAPHDVSVILGLLNEMPQQVSSQGGNYLHESISDVTVSLLSFPSGVKAHIFVSWLHPFKEQKLVVVGSKQMAVFDDVKKDEKLTLYPHSVEWQNQIPIANKADAVVIPLSDEEPLKSECQHFLDCVQNRTRPRTDGEEGLRVLTVLSKCQESLHLSASVESKESKAPGQFKNVKIHDSAFIDSDVVIGGGTSIWHVSHILPGSKIGTNCKIGQNVVVGPNVCVGNGVKIQNNVSVYEGVTLEDNVFCGPSMVFTNVFDPRSEIVKMDQIRPTLVKTGATLGANCTIVCGNTIGKYAFVGAGAVVVNDVPDHALVVGNPAKVIGWVCECGKRLPSPDQACECGKRINIVSN